MLKHLCVDNLAVIENIELSFTEGMTVLTGETGAGKSILIDALGLVLGDRADTTVIRTGCARAGISAMFDVGTNEQLLRLLDEQSVSIADNELLLRRTVNRDGPSRAYINTTAVPLQLLRDIGSLLIDIHGQHEHQRLLKRDEQRELLDGFGDYGDITLQVNRAYEKWDAVNGELRSLTEPDGETGDRISLLRYQVQELQALELEENEVGRLEDEYKRLFNINTLLETTQQALDGLYAGEQSVNDRINAVKRELASLERFDSGPAGINALLENASLHIAEAADELRSYLGRLDQDPERLQQVEQRLERLHDMARKHRVQPQQLYAHQQSITQQLAGMEHDQARLAQLEQEQQQALEEYRSDADELGERRRRCAALMAEEICTRIRTLGMPDGAFQINVTPGPDLKPHRNGNNQVEFLVSANPGQALLPLRKVASGGELSRISLAVQVSANRDSSAPTMIFDEVDAGIAGGIAEIVGGLLHRLSEHRQILCVTHLPQVASQGDNHFRVTKTSDRKTTETRVDVLNDEERVEEIARMLGGVRISQQSRDHAREMLETG
ncbi:MAG: DNA repair protein RecN [Gammaproteobacteria bacterium]|nr:DNA repair protein RecN [Gammaproteobacteria bacterium]